MPFPARKIRLTGDQSLVADHVLHLFFPGLDSEALMVATKDLSAVSNGSACTSNSYSPSHVLEAKGMSADEANGYVWISWCHLTADVDGDSVAERMRCLLRCRLRGSRRTVLSYQLSANPFGIASRFAW